MKKQEESNIRREFDIWIKDKDAHHSLTPLHHAMMSPQNTVPVLNLFPSPSLHTLGKHQETLLHLAARHNNLEGAKWLLAKGFTQLNALTDDKRHLRTALHIAAAYGHAEMVEYLLEQGAKPDVLNQLRETPIYEALFSVQEATAASFLKQGVWISRQEQAELFKTKQGASVKALMSRVLERERIRLSIEPEDRPVLPPPASSSSTSSSSSSSSSASSSASSTSRRLNLS